MFVEFSQHVWEHAEHCGSSGGGHTEMALETMEVAHAVQRVDSLRVASGSSDTVVRSELLFSIGWQCEFW